MTDTQPPAQQNVLQAYPQKGIPDEKLVHMKHQFNMGTFWRRYWPIIIAGLVSITWIAAFTYYVFVIRSAPPILQMPLENLTLYLSGAFIPIIVLWLAALVFLRTDPLREHRLALSYGLEGILSPINIAQKRLDAMLANVHRELKNVEATGDIAAVRIGELEGRFTNQITILFDSLTQAEKQSSQLQKSLSDQTVNIQSLSQQMEERTKNIETSVSAFTKLLQDATEQSSRTTDDVTAKLSQQSDEVSQKSQFMAETISRIREDLSALMKDMQQAATQTEVSFRDSASVLEQQQNNMSQAMAQITSDTQILCQQIDLQAREIASLSEKTREESQVIDKLLHKNTHELSQAAVTAMTQAKESGELFNMQSRRMSRSFSTSLDQNRAQLESYIDAQEQHLEQLKEKSEDSLAALQARSATITEDLSRRNEDFVHSLTVRQDAVRDELSQLTRDMENKLSQQNNILEQILHRHEQKSTATLNDLQLNTEQTLSQQMEQLLQHFSSHIEALEERAGHSADTIMARTHQLTDKLSELAQIKELSNDLDQKIDIISDSGTAWLEEFKVTLDAISQENDRAANAFEDLKRLSREGATELSTLTQNITQIVEQTQAIQKNITVDAEMNNTLIAQQQSIQLATSEAQQSLEHLNQQLTQAAEKIYIASASATEAADETLRAVAHQEGGIHQLLATLQKETKASSVQSVPVVEPAPSQPQEPLISFSRLSTQIMEKLNALSIDITRSVEMDIPDSLWNDYLKGDKSTFTRRLRKLTGRRNKTLIIAKYNQDLEFQRDVNEYIQLFEKMIGQAMRIDPNGPLTVSLISSDAGKAYLVLAQALDKLE